MPASIEPRDSAKTMSPSTVVFTGQMVRAMPRLPNSASFLACNLVRRALVATTASVVFLGVFLGVAALPASALWRFM